MFLSFWSLNLIFQRVIYNLQQNTYIIVVKISISSYVPVSIQNEQFSNISLRRYNNPHSLKFHKESYVKRRNFFDEIVKINAI
jgi:hypothetical protein